MLWNRYFLPSFLALSLVAALHWVGSVESYYHEFWWYDVMMHFFGGVWTAWAFLWVAHMPWAISRGTRPSVRSIVAVVCVVGVAWEVYEVVLGFSDPGIAGYAFDTGKDLVMDTLGALSVATLGARFTRQSHI